MHPLFGAFFNWWIRPLLLPFYSYQHPTALLLALGLFPSRV
jgi:hypothetical protein